MVDIRGKARHAIVADILAEEDRPMRTREIANVLVDLGVNYPNQDSVTSAALQKRAARFGDVERVGPGLWKKRISKLKDSN